MVNFLGDFDRQNNQPTSANYLISFTLRNNEKINSHFILFLFELFFVENAQINAASIPLFALTSSKIIYYKM